MQAPFQIAFEGVDHSDIIEAQIRAESQKLEPMDEHMTSARVIVAKRVHRHYAGDPYLIRIHLKVPGGADIHVNHDPGLGKSRNDMKVAIGDAFRIAHRRLTDAIGKRQCLAKAP
jgi:putative sigma-54 modulation protein